MYATLLDRCISRILGAADPTGIDLPPIIANPEEPRDTPNFPQFNEEEPDHIIKGSYDTWGAAKPGPPISDLFPDPETVVKNLNRTLRERIDAVLSAWRTDALQWFGRYFNTAAMKRICIDFPDLVFRWTRPALLDTAAGAAARVRLGSFIAELCPLLFEQNPELGLRLRKAMWSRRVGPVIFNAAHAAFGAPDNDQTNHARREVLDDCHDDACIAAIAYFAERHGRQLWLDSEIKYLIRKSALWRRAEGLTLASFSNIRVEQFDAYVALAQVTGTWVEAQIPALRANVRRNEFAQQWYELFLNNSDGVLAWGALQMMLASADERFFTWRSKFESEHGLPSHRLRFLASTLINLESTLDRQSKRKSTLFGIKIERGEIFPFMDRWDLTKPV